MAGTRIYMAAIAALAGGMLAAAAQPQTEQDLVTRARGIHERVITLEDPVEFVMKNDKCLISQREVGLHTATFHNGLRALLIVVIATSFFFALPRLPLADAIALSFISPVLAANPVLNAAA